VSLWGRQLLRAGTALASAGMLVCGLVIGGLVIAPRSAEAADPTLTWSAPSHIDDISDLASVSCPSASFCMAIDVGGNTFAWNGTSWSAGMTLAYASRFAFLSCASASFCMALGDTSDGAYYMWNGASWSSGSMPVQDVSEVSCLSASFCMAVAGVDSLTWNGSSWSFGAVIDDAVTSVSCTSASFCMAVDFEGDSVTWNGTSWSSPTADPAGGSDGGIGPWVSCSSASFCMATGDGGTGTWNGTSWSSVGAGPVANGLPLSVSCPSASFCVALAGGVGLDAQTWDGTSWSSAVDIDTAFGGPTLASVSCPSASFCAAVDESGDAITATGGTGALAPSTVSVSDDSQSVSPGGDLTFTATVAGSGPTPTGTVTWTLTGPGSPTCPDSTLSAGTATCTVSDAQPGTYTATADYQGDSNYDPASGTDDTAQVANAVPTVAVADNASSISIGGTLVFTATVTGIGPTPTGPMSWAVTGPSGASVSCSSTSGPAGSGDAATYTCSIASAVAGTYIATADYPGDSNYGSASGTDTAHVAKVAPTVTVADNASSISIGGTLIFTATVTGSGPTPTGPVSWTVTNPSGASVPCSSTSGPAGSGDAATYTCSIASAVAGTYTATAGYPGDSNYGPASGTDDTAHVAKVAPTVTVADNASSISIGGTLVFTATVTGIGPTPTGPMSWAVTDPSGASVPCSSTSGPAGSGDVTTYTCSIASAVAGTYTATAGYQGDSNYSPASGTDDTAHVAAATVTLKLSAGKVTYGHEKSEKLSVTVTPAPPTGTVTISNGTTTVCSINLSKGKGSCSLSNAQLAAGVYSLVATYAGEQSAQQLLIVAKATSKTALKLSAAKVTYGDEHVEKLSVTVTGQGKGLVPTGTVTIAESSTTICSISLTLGKGSCLLSAKQLAVGRYSLVATYAGQTDFVASASTRQTLTVVK